MRPASPSTLGYPRRMRVRKVRCPGCGAPKVTSYDRAYVYCDYCGRFMDWDVAIAKYAGQVQAGPHYRTLVQRMTPHLNAARGNRDLAALTDCHRTLFDHYMTDC